MVDQTEMDVGFLDQKRCSEIQEYWESSRDCEYIQGIEHAKMTSIVTDTDSLAALYPSLLCIYCKLFILILKPLSEL